MGEASEDPDSWLYGPEGWKRPCFLCLGLGSGLGQEWGMPVTVKQYPGHLVAFAPYPNHAHSFHFPVENTEAQ